MVARIKLILAVFLLVGALILLLWINIQGKQIKTLRDAKNTLEMNNNVLISRLEREHNDKVELSRKNRELEALAKRDIGFDWNTPIADTLVVRRLYENAIQVQRDRARAD